MGDKSVSAMRLAREYLRHGITPYTASGKIPGVMRMDGNRVKFRQRDFKDVLITAESMDISDGADDLGAVLPDDWVDIDCDCSAVYTAIKTRFSTAPACGRDAPDKGEGRIGHVILKVGEVKLPNTKFVLKVGDKTVFEYQRGGRLTLPPSVIKGHAYTWDVELHDEIPSINHEKQLQGIAFAGLLAPHWRAGCTHPIVNALGRTLHEAGWAADEIWSVFRVLVGLTQEKSDSLSMSTDYAKAPGITVLRKTNPEAAEVMEGIRNSLGGQVEEWGEPENVFARVRAAPMPLDVVPPVILHRAQNLADITGGRVEYNVMYGIAAVSIACGTRYRIRAMDEFEQVLSIFGSVVDISGGGKVIAAKMFEPLDEMERRAQKEHHIRLKAWKEKVARAKEDKRKDEAAEDPGPPPEIPWIVTTSFSMEGLARGLRNNPQGGGVIPDEVAGVLLSLNQYKGGKGDDDEILKELYDGKASRALRKSEEANNSIVRAHVTIFGGIQPDRLDEVLYTKGNVASGTAARFAFSSFHPIKAVKRDVAARRDAAAATAYADLLYALRDYTPPHWTEYEDPTETVLVLSDEAVAVFDAWQLPFADVIAATPAPLGPVWSKYRGLALRLAGLFHLAKSVVRASPGPDGHPVAGIYPETIVEKQTMQEALDFIEYLKAHSYRLYGASDAMPGAVSARAIARIIQGEKLVEFTVRDLLARERSGLAKRDTVLAGLKYLDVERWGRLVKTGSTSKGGRPSEKFVVNPRVHELRFCEDGAVTPPGP